MTFTVVALVLASSTVLFGVRQARTLRRTHGPSCVDRDEGNAWAGRILTWGVGMSIAAVALLPGASAPQSLVALLALDLPLVAAMVLLRRMQRRLPHELLRAATRSAKPLPM